MNTVRRLLLSLVALAAVLLCAAVPRLGAEDQERCRRRVAHAEHELHQAIDKHGRNTITLIGQSAGDGQIVAFKLNSDGTLTPVPGSPFSHAGVFALVTTDPESPHGRVKGGGLAKKRGRL